jgi:hypothetical protein
MFETMREHLKRREPWCHAGYFACLALMPLPVIPCSMLVLGHHNLFWLGAFALSFPIVGVGLLHLVHLKCPTCRAPLSLPGERSYVRTWCPHCGVNFDEPMPQRLNPIS